jgi:hypothetical protein
VRHDFFRREEFALLSKEFSSKWHLIIGTVKAGTAGAARPLIGCGELPDSGSAEFTVPRVLVSVGV